MTRPNILLITADQWRGDCLGAVGHPTVRTPHVDALAAEGTLFTRHYATCAPCSPARASLYTGLYQMNHRVVWNGTPLDHRFDNVARAARRAGYRPTLFGYTDTAPDPRVHHPNDPDLASFEGVLPGFAQRQALAEDDKPWLSWLAERGFDLCDPARIHHVAPEEGQAISLNPTRYGPDETQTAFLTGEFLRWLGEQEAGQPWFTHISYLRPHPPFAVPEPYNRMYAPGEGPGYARGQSPAAEAGMHPFVAAMQAFQTVDSFIPGATGRVMDLSAEDFDRIRALYFGMISEVDAQLGRLWAGLRDQGQWEETLIVFTSDHGEMMGDHWMLGKGGFFEASYHIPLVLRVPGKGGGRVEAFTSAADIMPTLLEAMGVDPLHHPDGRSLMPFTAGEAPADWRDAALWEFDFRSLLGAAGRAAYGLGSEQCVLVTLRDDTHAYTHSPGLPPALFDLADDPKTLINVAGEKPETRLAMAERLLSLRARHSDNTLANRLVWEG